MTEATPSRNVWFVTGGTGLVGSAVIEDMLKEDIEIIALVRQTSSKERIAFLKRLDAKLVYGDILDPSTYEMYLSGIKGVIHSAALVKQNQEPEKYFEVNAEGTKALLESMENQGIRRLVHMSSCGVYGYRQKQPITENSPTRPKSAYSRSKLKAENYILQKPEIDATIIRAPFIIGPRDRQFIPTLVTKLPKNVFPRPTGEEAKNGILHVKDLSNFIRIAAARDFTPHAIYNLQSAALKFTNIAYAVYRGLEISPQIIPLPNFVFSLIGSLLSPFERLFRHDASLKRRMEIWTKNWTFSTKRAEQDLDWHRQIDESYLIEKIERLTKLYAQKDQ